MTAPSAQRPLPFVWALAGIASAPIAILLHEAGHALAAIARDCADVAIHYAFMTSRCEEEPRLSTALGLAAGPAASWLTCLVSWCWARSKRGQPFALALAGCTAGRGLASAFALVPGLARHADEAQLAAVSGAPALSFVLPQVVLAAWVLRQAWRKVRDQDWMRESLWAASGACIGGILWLQSLGPWLLP